MRTLGNIRLIAELYKQEVVSEKILHACIQQMLGDGKSDPAEDDVEVTHTVCLSNCSMKFRPVFGPQTVGKASAGFTISPMCAQAMCEMLTVVGKKLEEVTKDKKRLDGYFAILEKWAKNKVRRQPGLAGCLSQYITCASSY